MGCCGFGFGYGWIAAIVIGAFFFLLLIGLIIAVIWVIRRSSRGSTYTEPESDALEIARRRLASGEITLEQYEEIRKRLQG